MIPLLVATRNARKTREFRQILSAEFDVTDLSQTADVAGIQETGHTFAENATLKAIAASQDRHLFVVADDSGLEVDALGGAPGIFSARYAGQNGTDSDNVEKLLRELDRVGAHEISQRTARFRCMLALARGGKILGVFTGTVDGMIVDLPRGSGGFGYDAVFCPNGFDRTFGELPAHVKNQISHRARAVRALRAAFQTGEANQGLGGGGGGGGAPGAPGAPGGAPAPPASRI